MRREGLVIVDAGEMEKLKGKVEQAEVLKQNNKGNASKPRPGNGNATMDDGSIITTYENAVKLVSKQNEGKRVSSSSEDNGMDTSDQIEKLEVDNMVLDNNSNVRVGNDKVLQFIVEN